jgi:hypothetical protein
MSDIIESEKLEVFHPEYGTQPRVYYHSLYKFDKSFIAGSVSFEENGRVDCAAGAEVKLYKDIQQIYTSVTDSFGDFKFDGLQEGQYIIKIIYKNYQSKIIEVELKTSASMPGIMMSY